MDGTRFIVAGSFIDGIGADVRRKVFLAVKNGIISAIGSAADLPRHDGMAIDDYSHCTIVPALVDCSVSLSQSPSLDRGVRVSADEADPAKIAAMLERHIRYCHAHGVLGVADSGEISGQADRHQMRRERRSIIDVRTAGSPGDFLRINYSGNIEDEGALSFRYSYEDLCRILQQKGEKKGVVLANGRQQVAEALEAGCDAIEQGYGMGEDNLRRMVGKEILWIPSLLRAKNALDGSASGGDVCCRFSTRYVAPGKPVPGAEALWKKLF